MIFQISGKIIFIRFWKHSGNLIKEGKIGHVGMSNETPWGAMRFLEESKVHESLPRMITIQNPYSLLNRLFEVGLSEISIREKLGLLAYSPLGFGVLSGKYLGGAKPANARLTLFPAYGRYSNENALNATQKYQELADKHGISLTQMALAFVTSRPFCNEYDYWGYFYGAIKGEYWQYRS